MPAQPWAYEAGGSEEAGRVIEPRNEYSRGQEDIPQGSRGGKPTVSSGRKAAVLGAAWRVRRTPPGSDVAADKASISRVKVPPYQLLDSDM